MKRTIVISDIHGCIDEFDELLDAVGYDANADSLILAGDYVDRGPHSRETVERVRKLAGGPNVVALRGNHDHRFAEIALGATNEGVEHFLRYGGHQTLTSYSPFYDMRDPSTISESLDDCARNHGEDLRFLMTLPLYYEDETHIYVHAGLNPAYADWKRQPDFDFMWIRDDFIKHKTRVDKPVVFGHTVVSTIHGSADIWFGGDKIGIDGGCAFGQQLNALVIQGASYTTKSVRSRQK